MKSCFMFGHADCPDDIMPRLEEAIEACYSKHGIQCFYVGNRGRFDGLAAAAVKRVKKRHQEICLYLLLAYHPAERMAALTEGFDGSYYPPLERVPRKYAIMKANQYMIDTADALICYVCHIGNTRTLLEYANRRKQKWKIEIRNVAQYRLGTDGEIVCKI